MMRMINDQFASGYYEYSTAIGLVYFVIVLILVGIVNLIISRRVLRLYNKLQIPTPDIKNSAMLFIYA